MMYEWLREIGLHEILCTYSYINVSGDNIDIFIEWIE